MLDPNRYLVIHREPKKAAQIKGVLERAGFRAACIHSGMEGVPKFETFKPGTVIIESGLVDMPVPVLVLALREMVQDFPIWLCCDEPNDSTYAEARAIDGYGVLQLPISARDLPRLNTQELDAWDDIADDTLEDFVPNFPWQEQPAPKHYARMVATDIMYRNSYRHEGNLVVIGDLDGVSRLDVGGELVVQGSVRNSTVRVRGPLTVTGTVADCREGGVFCRDHVHLGNIERSVVLAGKNLILEHHCIDSSVSVVQQMVAKSEDSRLVGGLIRVGEHLSIGILGDRDQIHTVIEMASPTLREAWLRTKKTMWKTAVAVNAKLTKTKGKAIRKHLEDPRFYAMQAELVASRIYPGIYVKIGKFEDYIFESYKEMTRIALGPKRRKVFGICVRPRKKKKSQRLKKEA